MSKEVLLFINSLGAGGAERALASLGNYLAKKSFKVTLATLAGPDETPFFNIDSNIDLAPLSISLKGKSKLSKLLKLPFVFLKIRKEVISHPNACIISFMDQMNISVLIASLGLRRKLIICEQVHPDFASLFTTSWLGPFRRLIKLVRNTLYRFADKIVLLSERSRICLPKSIQDKIVIIPNPASIPKKGELEHELPNPFILGIGRLCPQKGFDNLISAFSKIHALNPGWRLVILGEGKQRKYLENLATSLGLAEKVLLPGLTKFPGTAFKQASMFVLSSRYEGFPNVLLEAMLSGTPSIATNCLTGPSEIINHGVNGVLVPTDNIEELSKAINELINNEEKRQKIGVAGITVGERYSEEVLLEKWVQLIENSF